ncbi:MAG: hypothetical protein V3W34_14160 [Phycisphaerae bacterium]
MIKLMKLHDPDLLEKLAEDRPEAIDPATITWFDDPATQAGDPDMLEKLAEERRKEAEPDPADEVPALPRTG